jgi:hypothetical protein
VKQKLLVHGEVSVGVTAVALADIWRGMPVLALDGTPVGVVAAVVCAAASPAITHILLGQAPPTAVYRLIPLHLLDRLEGEQLWLRALPPQIDQLPTHQPEDEP